MLQRDIFVDVASPPPLFTRSFAPRPTAFFYARAGTPDSMQERYAMPEATVPGGPVASPAVTR